MSKKEIVWKEAVSLLLHLVLPAAAFLCIYHFVASPFIVSGKSMENSLQDEELIVIDRLGNPARGDIAVLHPPTDEKVYYVKRVIGLPGDMISFKGNDVYLNGKILDEPYTKCASAHEKKDISETRPSCDYRMLEGKIFAVPENNYFVMGDNRSNSSDSRTCFAFCDTTHTAHFVPRENIIGKKFSNALIPDEVGIVLGKVLKPLTFFKK